MKKHYIKIIFFLVLISVTAAFFLNYIYRQETQKTKAAPADLQLRFNPDTATAGNGQDFSTVVTLDSVLSFSTTSYDATVLFDPAKVQVKHIIYRLGNGGGDNDTTLAGPQGVNQTGRIHLQASIDLPGYPILAGSSTEIAQIDFTSLSTTGSSAVFDPASPHIFICSSGCLVDTLNAVFAGPLVINGGGAAATPTPTPCPDGDNCNPPVPHDTPTPTPECDPRNLHCPNTPTPVRGNTTLNMKVRLQGITTKPVNSNPLTMQVKVMGGVLVTPIAQNIQFTSNADGTWSGKMLFDLPDNHSQLQYSVYIKGPKHLQKRICDSTPTEANGGFYHCSRDAIVLQPGDFTMNFSGVLLLAGDLPVTNGQQNGLIDSEDTTYIRQNFGHTAADILAKADLNLDGSIDSQDFSLVIAALSIKYDDAINGQ